MKIFGLEIKRAVKQKALTAVDDSRGWFKIFDSHPGAWQQNTAALDSTNDLLTNSATYACITTVASDVAKLKPRLLRNLGTHKEPAPATALHHDFLRRPNAFQTWFQFAESWMSSKLGRGNAYALKIRDSRGFVTSARVLDPARVQPLVSDGGSVFYRLLSDNIAGLTESEVTVPASEIFHDRAATLFHPLIGVSPVIASAWAGTVGNKAAANSAAFFANMSQPGGLLSAPGSISDTTAAALKKYWDENFAGSKLGKVAVLADGLAYQSMTTTAVDAELVAQLNWSAADIARAFRIPAFMIGAAPVPQGVSNVESLIGLYYATCLQSHLEAFESVLTLGLELPLSIEVEFDLAGLLRTDSATRIKALAEAVGGGIMTPNEARRREGLPPIEGGDSCYLQMQNYSLQALARRDQKEDPFATSSVSPSGARSRQLPEMGMVYK